VLVDSVVQYVVMACVAAEGNNVADNLAFPARTYAARIFLDASVDKRVAVPVSAASQALPSALVLTVAV